MRTTCSLRTIFAAFALVVITLVAPVASAGEGTRGAVHRGVIEGETLVWRSQFRLGAQETTVRLASPLPIGSRLEKNDAITPIEERGQIMGFAVIDRSATSIAVVIHEALPRTKDHVHLTAPLADGDAVQIVDASGPGGLHFEPAAASILERRVGYYASPGLGRHERAETDAGLGYRKTRAGDLPLYVRATPSLASGIDGTLSTEAMRTRTGAIGAGVIFVGMIAALGMAYRRVAGAARFEHAERALEDEFARMDASEST